MCLSLTSTPDVTNTPSTLSLVEKISTFQGFLPGFFRAFVTWLSKGMMTSFTELSILSMFSDAVKMHKDLFIAVRIDLVARITRRIWQTFANQFYSCLSCMDNMTEVRGHHYSSIAWCSHFDNCSADLEYNSSCKIQLLLHASFFFLFASWYSMAFII